MTEEKKKIHCVEALKEGFDELPMREVEKMVGFCTPTSTKIATESGEWQVTTADGIYSAKSQFEAEVIASLEEIKALLIRGGKNDRRLD